MHERSPRGEGPGTPILDEIEALARHLREAEHLEPGARAKAASLLRELAEALDQPEPSDQAEQLARSAAELARAVNDRHAPGLIEAARGRVEQAIARAEAKAPVATDVVLQLVDVLSGLGI